MLIELFDWLRVTFGDFPGANLLRFLSVRTGVAIIVSLLLSIVTGGRIIRYLRRQQIGESVRDLGLEGQLEKKGTPTMGGLIILLAVLLPSLLFAKLNNIYLITMLVATVWMGAIGFIDDYLKIKHRNKDGPGRKIQGSRTDRTWSADRLHHVTQRAGGGAHERS